jgi:hypothetical protein
MKTLAFFFISIFLMSSPNYISACAENKKTYYAKITSQGTYFYSQCNEHSIMFEIPESYFVLLTGDANETYYLAKYGDCSGYVKKSSVTPMNGTPKQAYTNTYNIRVTSMSGLNLMERPTFESEVKINIDFLEDNLLYYGNAYGQEYFPNSTNIWHYCSYIKNNQIYYGYLFSYYCDFQTAIPRNSEYFDEITETLIFTMNTPNASSGSETIRALIILAVLIPLLIGCYFFISPKKKNSHSTKLPRRKRDYYELSESDLN